MNIASLNTTGFRIAISGAIMAASLVSGTIAGSAAPKDTYECQKVAAYQQDIVLAAPEDEETIQAVRDFMETEDITTISRSDLLLVADGFEEWAENMDDIDPPRVAIRHLELGQESFVIASNMLYAFAMNGPFGAMAYIETIEKNTAEMDDERRLAEKKCGEMWTDVFGAVDEPEEAESLQAIRNDHAA